MCLKDYIGFNWCNATEPESGLWINTLPGISLKSIDNLANAEQTTFLGVWSDVQDRAITKLNTFVTNHFSRRYRLNTIVQSLALGKVVDTVDNQTAQAAEYRGITIDMGIGASPLQRIYVQSVSIYSKAVETDVDINFYEVQSDDVLIEQHTITRSLVIGWNTIVVKKTFSFQKLFIGYDANSISSVYQSINTNDPSQNACCEVCIGDCCAYIRGASAEQQELSPPNGLSEGVNTFGLSGVFCIQCSYDALVCHNKNVFKTALWYLEGAEAMFERMFSERLNRFTTVDRKQAEELYRAYSDFADNELNNAIEGIKLDCDCCISKDAVVTIVDNLP